VVPRFDASSSPDPLRPPASLCGALYTFFDERRMLTTRHHVVGPVIVPVGAEILIARTADAVESDLNARVVKRLTDFLDPLTGGPAGEGWPFGRDVYVSELHQQLEQVPGVDYVPDLFLTSSADPSDTQSVAAPAVRHAEGDMVGLALAPHHL